MLLCLQTKGVRIFAARSHEFEKGTISSDFADALSSDENYKHHLTASSVSHVLVGLFDAIRAATRCKRPSGYSLQANRDGKWVGDDVWESVDRYARFERRKSKPVLPTVDPRHAGCLCSASGRSFKVAVESISMSRAQVPGCWAKQTYLRGLMEILRITVRVIVYLGAGAVA